MSLNDTVTDIKTKTEEFIKEIDIFVTKQNKAAAKRSRKLSLELEKLYKIYRKESILVIKTN